MIVYKVIHKYKLCKHNEIKNIGVYSSYELAEKAVEQLKTKQGFCDTQNGFIIKKLLEFANLNILIILFGLMDLLHTHIEMG